MAECKGMCIITNRRCARCDIEQCDCNIWFTCQDCSSINDNALFCQACVKKSRCKCLSNRGRAPYYDEFVTPTKKICNQCNDAVAMLTSCSICKSKICAKCTNQKSNCDCLLCIKCECNCPHIENLNINKTRKIFKRKSLRQIMQCSRCENDKMNKLKACGNCKSFVCDQCIQVCTDCKQTHVCNDCQICAQCVAKTIQGSRCNLCQKNSNNLFYCNQCEMGTCNICKSRCPKCSNDICLTCKCLKCEPKTIVDQALQSKLSPVCHDKISALVQSYFG